MYAPTRYLSWARRFFGHASFDLAISGMPAVPMGELGLPPSLDDLSAWMRLRDAIARYNAVSRDEVLPTFGTTHALWAAYSTLLAPGDDLLVEAPTYEPIERIAEGVGARIVRFERRPSDGYALDPSRIAAALTTRTRVIAVSNLHNPSGVRASDDVLREVAQMAASRGAHLLVDEVYAPFDALTDDAGVWSGTARRLGPNVVVASSLTKCFGLANHRIGWMLAPPAVVARGEDAITSSFSHSPLPYANLAAHAFTRLPALAARSRALLGTKRERVAAWMKARPTLRWSAPPAGLFGFAIHDRAGDLTSAIEVGLKEHDVLVAPGAFFGIPNGFRLAWSLDEARLDDALARLERVVPAL